MMSYLTDFYHHHQTLLVTIASVVGVTISLVASAHVVLTKRETRSAIGWIGLIWLSPFLGTILYVLLGINRINRKAKSLRRKRARSAPPMAEPFPLEKLPEALTDEGAHLIELARVVGEVTRQPLLAGNEIVPLLDGDEAYAAMLGAIDEATRSVSLCSYIFNDDLAGQPFILALKRAVGRGVEVRVLVDDLGARYDFPPVFSTLHREGVPVSTFMPTFTPGWVPYLNLRNHRKILVVDGRLGFTGGMNIDGGYLRGATPGHPRVDLHFRVRGPVVATLQHVFADDWAFSTREMLHGETWFPALSPVGSVIARGVPDGPDEDHGKLLLTILGAVACAERSVAIVTPYFVPDAPLISALSVASLRGVKVDILLPRQNNLALVQWASTPLLEQVLEHGCRVWYSPPPFDHTKLMIVDHAWSFIGSGNMDPRSLRLNFEFNVECYDLALAATLDRLIQRKMLGSTPVTQADITGRPLPIKLRDGVARLLSPYL
jgi:cardiolipin synthase A/B